VREVKVEEAERYRRAQAARFLRYCRSQGVDASDVIAGRVTIDLSPICGDDGTFVPERIDFR